MNKDKIISVNMRQIKDTGGSVGFSMNKNRGQHLLKNQKILHDIVDKSGLSSSETVLEIGPGTGNLTALLMERAKEVIAVEIDPRMVAQLLKRLMISENYKKLKLIQGDILKTSLPSFDLCIANIPYQISSPIIFKLLSHRPLFKCAILLVQKEFAMRVIAKPNTSLYCRLSVNVQLLAKCDHLIKVGRNNFTPPPKVDSSVIRIEPLKNLPSINFQEWDALLRICFSRKNKTLGSIFKQKKLISVLYKSYKVYKSQSINMTEDQSLTKNMNICLEDDVKDGQEEDSENSDDQDVNYIHNRKLKQSKYRISIPLESDQELIEFKEKLSLILNHNNFFDQRAIKMDKNDFLILLSRFNEQGIHLK